jgi:glycosyltransferase involved in cell wall biosynthesis
MRICLIICTYRRADDLERLLGCLHAQTYRDFEVLVVDGSGEDATVRDRVAGCQARYPALPLRLIQAPTGLTRQRNIGLREAQGDIIGFLDDDVSMGPTFLAEVDRIFGLAEMREVGGLTGFDTSYYPQPITWVWRLRACLGVMPGLAPGAADHLGRRVPIEFADAAVTHRRVGWLPGFCMLFRREAVLGLSFDEQLPTYAGEDKEFSMDVGRKWALALRADLPLIHHRSSTSRDDEVKRMYQIGFGMGRGFGRRMEGVRDYTVALRYTAGEMVMQLLRFVNRPGRERLRVLHALPHGILQGLASVKRP